MSARNILTTTLGVCFLFGTLGLAQAAPRSHKDTKKKDKKPAVTQSIGGDVHATKLKKEDRKKKEDKKPLASATGSKTTYQVSAGTKKHDKKHKDDKPLMS